MQPDAKGGENALGLLFSYTVQSEVCSAYTTKETRKRKFLCPEDFSKNNFGD